MIEFNLDAAPKPERKAPPAKEKKTKAEGAAAPGKEEKGAGKEKKKGKDAAGPAPVDPPAATAPGEASFAEVAAPAAEKNEGKKEKAAKGEGKKEKGGGEAKKGGAPAAAAADSGEPVPSMIDLRVGKIIEGMYLDISLAIILNVCL